MQFISAGKMTVLSRMTVKSLGMLAKTLMEIFAPMELIWFYRIKCQQELGLSTKGDVFLCCSFTPASMKKPCPRTQRLLCCELLYLHMEGFPPKLALMVQTLHSLQTSASQSCFCRTQQVTKGNIARVTVCLIEELNSNEPVIPLYHSSIISLHFPVMG